MSRARQLRIAVRPAAGAADKHAGAGGSGGASATTTSVLSKRDYDFADPAGSESKWLASNVVFERGPASSC